VVRSLLRRGARVRTIGRDASHAAMQVRDGARFVAADFDRPDSLDTAMAGVDGVFAMLPIAPGFAVAQARGNALVEALGRVRPARLVYSTSGFAVPALAAAGYVAGNIAMAARMHAIGVPLLVLRPGIYLDNLLWDELTRGLRENGVLAYPPLPPERRLSWTAHEDQGEAAATALLAEVFPQGEYDVAAHGAPSQAELAATLGRILGRPVAYQAVSPEVFGTALGQTLGSAEIGAGIAQMYAAVAASTPDAAVLAPDPIEKALGIRMHGFAEWLADNFR
jgi:uncharacterized protein YbjT (DUF2867 family)